MAVSCTNQEISGERSDYSQDSKQEEFSDEGVGASSKAKLLTSEDKKQQGYPSGEYWLSYSDFPNEAFYFIWLGYF